MGKQWRKENFLKRTAEETLLGNKWELFFPKDLPVIHFQMS